MNIFELDAHHSREPVTPALSHLHSHSRPTPTEAWRAAGTTRSARPWAKCRHFERAVNSRPQLFRRQLSIVLLIPITEPLLTELSKLGAGELAVLIFVCLHES